MNIEDNLQDQVALVTGASRGIGRAIAEGLGAAKATVIGTATTESGAQKITEYFAEVGITGEGMMLDVTNSDAIAETLKTINKNHGVVEILVNNAGITRDNLLMRMKDDEWDQM